MVYRFPVQCVLPVKGEHVKDVPTNIIFMDESAVSLWLDPSKTKNHFGSRAIYGAQYCFNVAS
jgi:hypothetical protein